MVNVVFSKAVVFQSEMQSPRFQIQIIRDRDSFRSSVWFSSTEKSVGRIGLVEPLEHFLILWVNFFFDLWYWGPKELKIAFLSWLHRIIRILIDAVLFRHIGDSLPASYSLIFARQTCVCCDRRNKLSTCLLLECRGRKNWSKLEFLSEAFFFQDLPPSNFCF